MAMHAHWGRLRDPDKALAYLRQSVVNRSRSHLRHQTVVRRHAAREAPPRPASGADDAAYDGAQRTAVLDALRRLPRRQREVLALRYYLDLSEAEIAETLGISRGAVKSHASRGPPPCAPTLGRPARGDPMNDDDRAAPAALRRRLRHRAATTGSTRSGPRSAPTRRWSR